ncbi:MAG: subclass B3 metallo-beta-lactamase [Xanthomonadales bacterium]|nr:subclass B3 metallo-beta-lactamase [Xanthomonadales bacterium]
MGAQPTTMPTALTEAAPPVSCSACAEWNQPQQPFRVFGNTYYVGTHGLGAILVTSPEGHVLIDGALPESAPLIRANIESLGFRMDDVRMILNSHAHFDHAGGIAELQRASGATVAASGPSAAVLEKGTSGADDPQHGVLLDYAPVKKVRVLGDGETVRAGSLALTAHLTPGHTHGGTTWSWQSCEGERCLDVVYADSLTAISAEGFSFTGSPVLADFERSYPVLERLPCDILLTPHPGASRLWERLAAREGGKADALVDTTACRRYAEGGRKQLQERLGREAAQRKAASGVKPGQVDD